MTTPIDPLDQPLTLRDLKEGLTLNLNFIGWDYGGHTNKLTVALMMDGIQLCSSDISIDPSGYEREKDSGW